MFFVVVNCYFKILCLLLHIIRAQVVNFVMFVNAHVPVMNVFNKILIVIMHVSMICV